MKPTDNEQDILDSLLAAYVEDPSPESGRTYMADEPEYEAACDLMEAGLVREVTTGIHANVRWAHFGLTDEGLEAAKGL